MDKFDYQKTLATAVQLLNKFGSVVFKQSAYDTSLWEKEYDPVTGSFTWTNIASGAEQTVEPEDDIEEADGVVVVNISDELLENSLVKRSDRELLIIGIKEPVAGDTFTVNNVKYKYIAHDTVNPAGTALLYKIAVRK